MNRWIGGAAALLVVASTAACGGKPEGCITVERDVAQAIVNGGVGDLQLTGTGRAIEAPSGVYYVAYKIQAAGSDEVGVWALSEIDPPGSIRSVDGYAQQFTEWPALAGGNGSQGADDAKACLD